MFQSPLVFINLILLLACPFFGNASQSINADICVYGGTSGGVVAAIAGARLGKQVVIVAPERHLGGMTASGLSVTDIGKGKSPDYIGGIAAEFYERVGKHYGSSNAVFIFEPHVAEKVFAEMLADAGVDIHVGQRLKGVNLSKKRISCLQTEAGFVINAKEYIDGTYEGDLLAASGVSFTVGRESRAKYGETLAGVRPTKEKLDYSPYIKPNDDRSGCLPYVHCRTPGAVGTSDASVQPYTFRLCLTQNPTNMLPVLPPVDYKESDYEVFARYLESLRTQGHPVRLSDLIHIQRSLPGAKADINSKGDFSTDFIGFSHSWATNTFEGRERIRVAHESYIRGLLHFLSTSGHVPEGVRTAISAWGLAKDEFTDNGGWPWQLYVREARRMVSDYVMTQQNVLAERVAPDSVGLAAYGIDCHPVHRFADGNKVYTEGGIGIPVPGPYPISYGSVIPKIGECENLGVVCAISASHVAFASIRMEPVFMILGQSVGTAASFALDDNVPLQKLNTQKLATQLTADGQRLRNHRISSDGVIVDQGSPGTSFSQGWSIGANPGGWGGDFWHDGGELKGKKWVKFVPLLPDNGEYEVSLWWVHASNRSTNVLVEITHPGGIEKLRVNQRMPNMGWHFLIRTNFLRGDVAHVVIRNDGTSEGSYAVADAVRFSPVSRSSPRVSFIASDPVADESGTNVGRVTVVRDGNTDQALKVFYTVRGSALNGKDYRPIKGSIVIPPGAVSRSITIDPVRDHLAQVQKHVEIVGTPCGFYSLSSVNCASVIIKK